MWWSSGHCEFLNLAIRTPSMVTCAFSDGILLSAPSDVIFLLFNSESPVGPGEVTVTLHHQVSPQTAQVLCYVVGAHEHISKPRWSGVFSSFGISRLLWADVYN